MLQIGLYLVTCSYWSIKNRLSRVREARVRVRPKIAHKSPSSTRRSWKKKHGTSPSLSQRGVLTTFPGWKWWISKIYNSVKRKGKNWRRRILTRRGTFSSWARKKSSLKGRRGFSSMTSQNELLFRIPFGAHDEISQHMASMWVRLKVALGCVILLSS